MNELDRRTLLLASAGLLLAGCGGGKGDKKASTAATSSGPNIVKPKAGTVVSQDDLAALRGRLDAAFASGDVEQLVAVIDPGDYALDDVRKRWSRRFDNFERLGFVEGQWYVGEPSGRTRNGAGGLVEYSGDLVFAHTVAGCDGQQVVESYGASFRKKSEDAPLELMHVGEANASFDPSIWDVATIDAIETDHARIVFRPQDAKRAKAFASRIDAGAARAFEVMPRPRGVDKVLYVLTWPQIDGRLYGGVALGEADAHAYYHPFLDPAELAKGQKIATASGDLPKATGRVGLHQASFGRSDFVDVACHEAVHVLANQWLVSNPPTWVAEGLASWSEGPAKLAAGRARVRSAFPQFERVATQGYDAFHDSSLEYEFYLCSAAVFAYLEDDGGADAVLRTAQSFYGAQEPPEVDKTLARRQKDLLKATRGWLGA